MLDAASVRSISKVLLMANVAMLILDIKIMLSYQHFS